MKTHQILLTCSLICLVLSLLFSQQNAVAAPLNTNIDFTGFTGSGFAPSPAAGQLDSDTWRLTGMSTGDQTFGGTHTSDDSARGSDTGGTTTGGVYAFDRGGGNIGLGVQPTGSDFTPGEITLRLRNETGTTVTNINVAYYLGVFNDQDRGNTVSLSYSTDDTTYTTVPTSSFVSTEARDAAPTWQGSTFNFTITGLNLLADDVIYLQWDTGDSLGSGSRDEFVIDNIVVSDVTPTAVTLNQQTTSTNAQNGSMLFLFAGILLAITSALLWIRSRTMQPVM